MDSIIFDLDGTLWDSRKIVAAAWNAAIEQNKLDAEPITVEDLKSTMGLQMPDIMKKLFPQYDETARNELIETCGEIECVYLKKSGGVLYPEVKEIIGQLAEKYPLYIISNCQEGYIEAFLAFHEMEEYFKDFENPGRTGLTKGENIQLLMERNGLKDPIYVGDTIGDQQAAGYAGIPFVYAAYGFGEVESFDQKIDRFEHLLEVAELA
ncbi:HAD family hydrolase [Planococcus ruber]|uniref:HAD family hydrolase n=1 Tax=Planococcus ruber TaxID=2027871 RepID=UPI001FEE1233|nr:HAD family hydrolase [Planococcus ruber]